MKYSRNRLVYAALVLTVIALGLASRRFDDMLPAVMGKYSGDILWALMVYLIIGFLIPKLHITYTALAALTFSVLIEISQLYHAPWIDAIRATRFGGLVLGYGFLWSDILCYSIGIILGIALEISTRYKHEGTNTCT